MAQNKILYFINSTVVSKEESELASNMEGKVCFRNATFIDPKGAIEKCDFVYGCIPETYKELPIYGESNEAQNERLQNLQQSNPKDCPVFQDKANAKEEKVTDKPIWKPNA